MDSHTFDIHSHRYLTVYMKSFLRSPSRNLLDLLAPERVGPWDSAEDTSIQLSVIVLKLFQDIQDKAINLIVISFVQDWQCVGSNKTLQKRISKHAHSSELRYINWFVIIHSNIVLPTYNTVKKLHQLPIIAAANMLAIICNQYQDIKSAITDKDH